MQNKFDKGVDFLGKEVEVVMDRPLGSLHPKHGFEYKLNYGYIPNTVSGDGEELDAYIMGVDKPLKTFKGEVIAVVHRTTQEDDKLVVVPKGMTFSNEQIREATHFQEQWFPSEIIREKTKG